MLGRILCPSSFPFWLVGQSRHHLHSRLVMLLGFLRVGFGDEPLVDFYFCLALWTLWLLLVAKVVTVPSEDPMANQVPFG